MYPFYLNKIIVTHNQRKINFDFMFIEDAKLIRRKMKNGMGIRDIITVSSKNGVIECLE